MRKSLPILLVALAFVGCSSADPLEAESVAENQETIAAGTSYNFKPQSAPSSCLDVAAAGTADGTRIQQWACNGTGAQVFRPESLGGGLYRVVNPNSGKCVDVAAGGTADGTSVQLWTCNGTAAQSFRIDDLGSGKNRIVSSKSSKCLDVSGASTANGAKVQIWTCNGTGAQTWAASAVGSAPQPSNPTSSGGGIGGVVSETQFNQMFPHRSSFYTYQGLVSTAQAYGAFANSSDVTLRKREAAAFLANVGHETGDLVYIEEINKGTYCSPSSCGGCPAGAAQYYGRGPIQLTWNCNYKAAGDAIGVDLLNAPWRVAQDASIAWKTGVWFWMTQAGAGTQTPHNGILNVGFGETIRSINGSLECGGKNPAQIQSRIDRYKRFCDMLGVSYGSNLSC
jgi:predicted chitinase